MDDRDILARTAVVPDSLLASARREMGAYSTYGVGKKQTLRNTLLELDKLSSAYGSGEFERE